MWLRIGIEKDQLRENLFCDNGTWGVGEISQA